MNTDGRHDVVREEQGVRSDGYRLAVRLVMPERPVQEQVIILVHGLTFPSVADFDLPVAGASLCQFLAERGVACCIFDLRGYGRSDKPPYGEAIGMAERARDLHAVWEWVARRFPRCPISLGGLSSGCNTIAEFLHEFSRVPQSVVFIAPCYLLNPAMQHVLRRARFIRTILTLAGRPRSVYASLSRGLVKSRLYRGEESLIDQRSFNRFLELSIGMTSPDTDTLRAPVLHYPEVRGFSRRWTPIFDASVLRSPLLIVRGERDEFCCARSADALARNVPESCAKVVTMPGCKHDIHLYQVHEKFFTTVARHLQGISTD